MCTQLGVLYGLIVIVVVYMSIIVVIR